MSMSLKNRLLPVLGGFVVNLVFVPSSGISKNKQDFSTTKYHCGFDSLHDHTLCLFVSLCASFCYLRKQQISVNRTFFFSIIHFEMHVCLSNPQHLSLFLQLRNAFRTTTHPLRLLQDSFPFFRVLCSLLVVYIWCFFPMSQLAESNVLMISLWTQWLGATWTNTKFHLLLVLINWRFLNR